MTPGKFLLDVDTPSAGPIVLIIQERRDCLRVVAYVIGFDVNRGVTIDISLNWFSPLGAQQAQVARRDQGLALEPNPWVEGHRQVLDKDQGAELHLHQSIEQAVLIR